MARCDVCGNDYDKTLQVTQGGRSMTFDSFECAIQAIEAHGKIFCCAHCAKQEGVKGVKDRAA
jgi:hypothetical protein